MRRCVCVYVCVCLSDIDPRGLRGAFKCQSQTYHNRLQLNMCFGTLEWKTAAALAAEAALLQMNASDKATTSWTMLNRMPLSISLLPLMASLECH